jgi:DNA-binding beta-propeller fold protein YncE
MTFCYKLFFDKGKINSLFHRSALRTIATVVVIALMIGCDDDDNSIQGKYEHGVFIVNEGNFGAGNGTVSHYDPVSGVIEENIYKNAAGNFAGDVLQSLTIQDDLGFLVINGENKIDVFDATSFERRQSYTAPEFDKPRYAEVINDKAYFSVWGPYGEGGFALVDSYVLVVDMATHAITKRIPTDEGTDNLLYAGGYLFASNNNFGGSRTVAVIDPDDDSLVDQIELASGPGGSVIDSNGKVWVICSGDYGASNGQLFRIEPTTLNVEESIALNLSPDSKLSITPDKMNLIYSAGKSIYKLNINATSAPAAPFFTIAELTYNYAIGVDPARGDIYVGDALNFDLPGTVYVYDADGSFKTSFTAGISPTQFVFK